MSVSTITQPQARLLGYILLTGVLVGLSALLSGADWLSDSHTHGLFEFGATLLALITGGVALARYHARHHAAFLFIGAGFIGTAALDAIHGLLTSTSLHPYMPSELSRLGPWSWLAPRLFLSLMLGLAWSTWLFERRRAPPRLRERTVYAGTVLLAIACLLLFVLVPLPPAQFPDLVMHRPEELLPAILFAATLAGYWVKGGWRQRDFEHWLMLSLIVSVISQTGFMLYSGAVFDLRFDIAHGLKALSYGLVLVGLLRSMTKAFRREQAAGLALEQQVGEHRRVQALLEARAHELDQAHELQQYHATHDFLTGLPNRQLFHDRLEQAVAYARRYQQTVAVLFMDLDRFKIINDTLGHAAGDELLRTVAERLRASVRGSDTVARLGGDEFTAVLVNLSQVEDAATVARKVLAAMTETVIVQGHELHLSGSIGIAVYPGDGDNAATLVQHADVAMYCVKQDGRNGYHFYTADLDATSRARLLMEHDLRKAIERQELLLHYQPLVEVHSNKVIAVEALLRWPHPRHGMIPPDQFIPLAEETGLIRELGEWVLRTACAQNKAWQDQGLAPIRMAVNLSPRQFADARLVERILTIVQETGLSPHWLELELTEGVVLQNPERVYDNLVELKKAGIRIAIDDFGTGYSSLSYLNRFPVDSLKVDRSFIRDICTDHRDAAITKATIAMAHSLGLKVVAEGVETVGQLAFLQSHACDSMQGYLFSRPVAAETIGALLQPPRNDDVSVAQAAG